jgi:pentalenolactone synthase
MRALLQPHFTPRLMRALEPRVDALTRQLLDDLARQGSPADLHVALALPLPILVICELLGVPYEDRERFRCWSEAAGNTADRELSSQGLAQLFEYGQELVARKRGAPAGDVISRLIAIGASAEEIAGLSMALLFAGHETTVVQLGDGALQLLTHPDQRQLLLDDPSLIPDAVEEMLRVANKGGGTGGIPRYARTDLEIDGTTVPAGDLVLLDVGAANHDPVAFPDPERFDVTRRGATHLAFGHGPRYCIGAPLARIELRSVFAQLLPRFPTMRLAVPVDELTTRADTLTGGLTSLPVEW